jgi:DNA-binding HxlR family transcriptional regulator
MQAMQDHATILQAVEKILAASSDIQNREQSLQKLTYLIQNMSRDGVHRDMPVREIPARLGDRWSTLLMLLLRTGAYRHSTLRRLVSAMSAEGKISQRMLTLRLRTLERDGIVSRHVTSTHPPGMEYALTELGNSLLNQIDQLMEWIRAHQSQIMAAREAFATRAAEHAANQHLDN